MDDVVVWKPPEVVPVGLTTSRGESPLVELSPSAVEVELVSGASVVEDAVEAASAGVDEVAVDSDERAVVKAVAEVSDVLKTTPVCEEGAPVT